MKKKIVAIAYANYHNYTTSLSENNWLVSIGWYGVATGRG